MKKISLRLPVLALSLMPIITMASCSSVVIEDLKISITKNPVTQIDINQAVIDYNSAITTEEKVVILNRLFSGVTTTNFNNFKTTTTTTSITLTALPNFAFGTNPTIKARVVTI